jgi:hypothetical protein
VHTNPESHWLSFVQLREHVSRTFAFATKKNDGHDNVAAQSPPLSHAPPSATVPSPSIFAQAPAVHVPR